MLKDNIINFCDEYIFYLNSILIYELKVLNYHIFLWKKYILAKISGKFRLSLTEFLSYLLILQKITSKIGLMGGHILHHWH